MKTLLSISQVLVLAFTFFQAPSVHADEGMWLLNHFPSSQVQKKYNFDPAQPWLDEVRLSSVRLARGCSGSFVSPEGLVLTNHHCAHSCIEQLSTAKHDFVATGFYAQTLEQEVKCPEMEINQLTKITDVTDRITKVTLGLSDKKANEARKAEMSKIEKECAGNSDNVRCDVVTLYHGGKYHLYQYRRFQDVRLVFAPEFAIAFFGGDPDNFNFPRYDFDLSMVRVYEGGKPLKTDHYFSWSANGAKEGELTFVSGHPGGTDRLLTIAELETARDFSLLQRQLYLSEQRGLLTEFQKRGPEQKRFSNARLFGVENALKAFKGRHQAILDADFFAQKVKAEQDLRRRVNANPKWRKQYGNAWTAMAKIQPAFRNIYKPLVYLEQGRGFTSSLYGIARNLVRSTDEIKKPNEKRLREYADSNMPAIKQELFSAAPIYDEFEVELLTFGLTKLREELGTDDPRVKAILGAKSPSELATSLVQGTRLKDIEFRKKLFEGGKAAIDGSTDPMIQFARLVDPYAREVRKNYEDNIESVMKKSSELIARAQFAVYGEKTYPDATFTLRLSYGQVKGYEENGKVVQPFTHISGLYNRATGRPPFELPESWVRARDKLNPDTPMNFVTDNDIIGGNSGSPVINRDRQVVGLIFDGNIQSLGGEYGFDASVNRAVAVHSSVIVEALQKVYGAGRIADELKRK